MMTTQWTTSACFLTVLVIASIGTVSGDQQVQQCSVRFEDTDVCACSTHNNGLVKCGEDNHSIQIQPCYCMYYDQHLNMSVLGQCYFTCYMYPIESVQITTSTRLNDNICNQYWTLHRVGRFCGQCNDSYGLAVYSYQYVNCVPCEDYGYKNWLKYFAVALLPLTVFYILAVLMSFNVTSSVTNGIVLVAQCITARELLQWTVAANTPPVDMYLNKILVTITCIVNLDFFRWIYPPFCLHPNATTLEVLALDYIVALYPFLLIFMTYVLVTAYDKQYRVFVWMWKPFKLCTRRYRQTWNIRSSLIEIFATFILLSSVKILGVSFQILSFTRTFDVTGKQLDYYLVRHDPNIEYFSSGHLPFALLAMAISFIFVLLPLLLLAIYPCGCFHKCCLNRCGLTCQTLHVFMDAFQGSYRTRPRDMRYFSALYLLLRIILLLNVQAPLNLYTFGVISLIFAGAVTLFRPYKVAFHNAMDSIFLILMGVYTISILVNITGTSAPPQKQTGQLYQSLAIIILSLCFFMLVMWKLLQSPIRAVIRKVKAKRERNIDNGDAMEWFDRSAPDTAAAYPPLLPPRQ